MRTTPALAVLMLLAAACGGNSTSTRGERHLLFVRGPSQAAAVVWIADVSGRHAHRLTHGFAGVISPDGRRVAVARGDGLYLVPSRGGRARLLTHRPLRPQEWSPDGERLLAATATSLALVDRESGSVRVVARGPIYGADISSSGDELVYSRAPRQEPGGICADQFDLYVAPLDGGEPERITHDGLSAFPVWGPSRIAFAHFPGATAEDCRSPGIWTIDADGSDPVALLSRAPDEVSVIGSSYYGLQPVSWPNDDELLVGVRGSYGIEAAALDTRTHRLRRFGGFADDVSADGRFVVGGGEERSQLVALTRVSDGKRLLALEDACCPDWNR